MERSMCDACHFRGKLSRSMRYCKTCQEALCRECADVHKSSKGTKCHFIVNIKDLNVSSEAELAFQHLQKCIYHPKKNLEFFCKEHYHLICSYCVLQHKMVNCRDIFEVANGGNAILNTDFIYKVRTDIQTLTQTFEHDKQRIRAQQSASRQEHMEMIQTLNEIRTAVLERFKRLENEILFGVRCDEERQNQNLENFQARINKMLLQVNDASALLESTIENGSATDVFKCIMLIGNLLDSSMKVNQGLKMEPIWICQNSIKVSDEMKLLLDQYKPIIERCSRYVPFPASEFSPLKTSFAEFLKITDNHSLNAGMDYKDNECHSESEMENVRCNQDYMKEIMSYEEQCQIMSCRQQTNIPNTDVMNYTRSHFQKLACPILPPYPPPLIMRSIAPLNIMVINPFQPPATAFALHLPPSSEIHQSQDNFSADKTSELNNETKSNFELNVIPSLKRINDDDTALRTDIKQNEIEQSRKPELKQVGNIDDIFDDKEANNQSPLAEHLSESLKLEHTNCLESSTICEKSSVFTTNEYDKRNKNTVISNETNKHNERDKEVVCFLENENKKEDDLNHDRTCNSILKEEINKMVKKHINVDEQKKNKDDKEIVETIRPESAEHAILKFERQNHDSGVSEVSEKAGTRLSDTKFNITGEAKIKLPLRKTKTFNISVLAPSSDRIIVCDYHNNELTTFDAKQQELKHKFELPAKMINIDHLKGQIIAACHETTAKISIISFDPSFKLVRIMDTQYKAKCVQSVDDTNMLVSMRDSAGRWHLHILSNTGQVVDKLNLNRSILDCKSLAVLSSEKFRFGYRILQCCLTANSLFCFEKDGKDIFKLKLKSPDCVAVHDSGFIFVTERQGRIHVLSSSGQKLYETECCSDVTSIAITPSMDKILLTRSKDKSVTVLFIDMNNENLY
ncbi:uncharacterized protein LOC132720140 [Ruditapes philippinarum]|uniref:uncharacterized protein LOC132720140 n=1 Tax=Ruditapes philippinarum TaxID=129788 RepID=UPI00295A7F38|nr:uncharacterized protein LOC132720140 [Ruditapes philippinarum]